MLDGLGHQAITEVGTIVNLEKYTTVSTMEHDDKVHFFLMA
jgi:hypothetical protein